MRKKKIVPLPCPFCGFVYKGQVFTMEGGPADQFECYHCGAMGPLPFFGSSEKQKLNKNQRYYDLLCVEPWNTRVK